MKKISFLPLLAMAVFVSQAMAQDCTSNNGATLYFCAWDQSTSENCWKLDVGSKTCAERASDCGASNLYTSPAAGAPDGGSCPGLSLVSDINSIVFDTPANLGEGPCLNTGSQLFCQYTWGCLTLDTRYSSIGEGSSAVCSPTTTPCTCTQLTGDCPTLYINVDKQWLDDHDYGNGATCTEHGGTVPGNNPPPPPNSILGGFTPVPLNVIPHARSLQITSGAEATVALFDMQGKQVFTKRVAAGLNVVVSLEKQKQGVYYAVVQSGSQKQTVKVVLK